MATNREDEAGQFGAQFGVDTPEGSDSPAAETSPRERYPVLWRPGPMMPDPPVPSPRKSFILRLIEALASIPEEEEPDEHEVVRSVSSFGFPWKDLPARACSQCGTPLPDEIGDRQVLKIGIVGTTGAGKSHFLAALIREGAHKQGLRKWGIAEFELVETSSEMYRDRYEPFWRDRRVLDPNNPADAPEVIFQPLIVRVTYLRGTMVLLYLYDIDGESLVNRGRRARYASYLRHPHGLIFLIDPMMIDSIRKHLPPSESDYQRFIRQGDLVNACIADLEADRVRNTPIAIVLSKSDLVVAAADRRYPFTFSRPATASDPIDSAAAEMAQIHREVREVLGAAGERDLLAVADRLGPNAPLTFHAVAPIGYAPQDESGVHIAPEVKPLRCLDPLIALISPWVREQIRLGQ